jgi:hypothetical protein
MYIVHTLDFGVKTKYFVHCTTVHKKNSTVGTRIDFPESPDSDFENRILVQPTEFSRKLLNSVSNPKIGYLLILCNCAKMTTSTSKGGFM